MSGHSVFGIYSSREAIEVAVEELKAAQFRASDISLLSPENLGDIRDLATVKSTKAPEGAAAGGTLGTAICGLLGWFIGTGAIALPHAGAYVSAGPVLVALAGMGAGAVLGGLIGAVVGAGKPEFEARRYQNRLNKGGILLSVHADNETWIARAKTILQKTGAENVAKASERRVA